MCVKKRERDKEREKSECVKEREQERHIIKSVLMNEEKGTLETTRFDIL